MLTTTLALAFASLALAQNTINVQVGPNGQIAYVPPSITANPGDIVNFAFNSKAHTLTQSSFGTPCIPIPGGVDTGFVNVTVGAPPIPRQFTVPPGNGPLWFFCRQIGHCGQGMVFAINAPTSGNTFAAFQAAAIAQNGTAAASATAAATTTIPPPTFVTETVTVTFEGSTYTTTYSSYAGTGPPTPTANPITHTIIVGDGGLLQFNPSNISASIGDTVTFEFRPKAHSVTQSNFGNPCETLQQSTGKVGFDSGLTPVAANATTFPTFSFTVNDTAPIWGYCRQVGHCPQGMVFSVNAVESGPNNFAAFKGLALASNASASASASSTGTGTGAASPSGSASGAISTSVSVGLTGILAIVGMVALAL
ncbi:hypothetical protein BYT27DRAFT_7195838 [Phlegmacium glaucopus]|nr:hypothetical protein BYT27DRAFT_7195838 [Phlegmacium glaucopus]